MGRPWVTGLVAVAGVAVAGLVVAAPGDKDAPKQPSPIVGEWRLLTIDGQESVDLVQEYRANGDLEGVGQIGMARMGFRCRYTTDEKAEPFQIDETQDDVRREGIFKVEGDRLTVSLREGRGTRPKKFGEKGAIEEVFERVKKKD
jgi:uncharacterized protein (TIGR03067 family)